MKHHETKLQHSSTGLESQRSSDQGSNHLSWLHLERVGHDIWRSMCVVQPACTVIKHPICPIIIIYIHVVKNNNQTIVLLWILPWGTYRKASCLNNKRPNIFPCLTLVALLIPATYSKSCGLHTLYFRLVKLPTSWRSSVINPSSGWSMLTPTFLE